MALTPLGRLADVRPRDVWPHEALDFTPWLLQNVDVLSDLLGMELVLEAAEHPVGNFSLDLLGYDQASGDVVIVENQLEISDHIHLGQIVTYAAGTQARTIVWVAAGFRAEHRAAIDWLNQRTDESTRIFAVAVRVVRIGDSQPAPAFELVAQPNDWGKQVKTATTVAGSERTTQYRAFWEAVLERVRAVHPAWTRARTSNSSWCDTSVGLSGVAISMAWSGGRLVAQIYFSAPDAYLNGVRLAWIEAHRATFEAALGAPALFDAMGGRKATRIVLASEFTDVAEDARWPEMAEWLIDRQVRLRAALDAVGGVQALRDAPQWASDLVDPDDAQADAPALPATTPLHE